MPDGLCLETEESRQKTGGVDACTRICDDSERFTSTTDGRPQSETAEQVELPVEGWLLDEESQKRPVCHPFLQGELLPPYTYNFTPGQAALRGGQPGHGVQDAEAKFQISLKMKLWQDILGTERRRTSGSATRNCPYGSSTTGISPPPSARPTTSPRSSSTSGWTRDLFGLMTKPVHPGRPQSPVQRPERAPLAELEPDSWRTSASSGMRFDIVLKTWYRFPESAENDDNPDIDILPGVR